MRPLTETIGSSGRGKKPPHISGLLPDRDTVRVNGKQEWKQPALPQTGHTTTAATTSATNTPRRGTFSLQNGYGYPLNGYSNSNNTALTHQSASKYAKPSSVLCSSSSNNNMDKSQEEYTTTINGHGASNMSPGLTKTQGDDSNTFGGLVGEQTLPFHHHQHNMGHMLDIQCDGDTDLDSFHEDDFLTQRFYVHETPSPTDSQCTSLHSGVGSGDEEEEHPFFAGMRDVRHPETLKELKIVSSKGTIRGVKNRVKAGIATFLNQGEEAKKRNYRGSEKGKIVIYTTSMMIVRDTHEKCKKVKNILQTHMVKYEERDIFMSRENQRELSERLENENIDVPQVFADGLHLGGADELERFNESGELRRIFRHFKKINHASSCESCGGYRYIPCTVCHGSRKSVHRNHFTAEFCALRCIVCDENGLVKCDTCGEPTSDSEKTKL